MLCLFFLPPSPTPPSTSGMSRVRSEGRRIGKKRPRYFYSIGAVCMVFPWLPGCAVCSRTLRASFLWLNIVLGSLEAFWGTLILNSSLTWMSHSWIPCIVPYQLQLLYSAIHSMASNWLSYPRGTPSLLNRSHKWPKPSCHPQYHLPLGETQIPSPLQ